MRLLVRGTCAWHFTYDQAESQGPRGGRHTSSFGVCMDCGYRTGTYADKRAGNNSGRGEAFEELRARRCPSPRQVDAGARLLFDVAELLRKGEKAPLVFAVEHSLGGAASLTQALDRAWSTTTSGVAMGEVLTHVVALETRGHGGANPGWPWNAGENDAGTETHVSIIAPDGVTVWLRGPDALVAKHLRRAIQALRWGQTVEALGLAGAS